MSTDYDVWLSFKNKPDCTKKGCLDLVRNWGATPETIKKINDSMTYALNTGKLKSDKPEYARRSPDERIKTDDFLAWIEKKWPQVVHVHTTFGPEGIRLIIEPPRIGAMPSFAFITFSDPPTLEEVRHLRREADSAVKWLQGIIDQSEAKNAELRAKIDQLEKENIAQQQELDRKKAADKARGQRSR